MMKQLLVWMCAAAMAATVCGQAPQKEIKVPRSKWFNGGRDYPEALEIQKATGADMLVYFARTDTKDEKGLCSWWERHGLQDGKISKLLQDYVKVRIDLPYRNDKEEALFKQFRFNKTPAVYVVKTNGFPARIHLFDKSTGELRLQEPDKLVEQILQASTPKDGGAE